MGQQEIIEYLKDHPTKWFTLQEIKEGLQDRGVSTCNIYDNIGKLLAFNQIRHKGVGFWKHKKLFSAKQ